MTMEETLRELMGGMCVQIASLTSQLSDAQTQITSLKSQYAAQVASTTPGAISAATASTASAAALPAPKLATKPNISGLSAVPKPMPPVSQTPPIPVTATVVE